MSDFTPSTPEQRQRAVDRWFTEIRPTFKVSDRPAPRNPAQAKAKLRALRADLDDAAFESFWIGLGTHVPKSSFAPLKG